MDSRVVQLVDALGTLFPHHPYFDGATCGVQGDVGRYDVISGILGTLSHRGHLDVLEIGSWIGRSALTWAKSLETYRCTGSITCVDPWRSYIGIADFMKGSVYSSMNYMLTSGLAYALFLHNTKFIDHRIEFSHHVGTLTEAKPKLSQYDIIYIDASHYYKDVMSDLRESHSLLREGGIICGDDLERQLHEVDEAWVRENQRTDFATDPTSGFLLHPGVTAAVADTFGGVWSRNAVWAMRKVGDAYVMPG